MKCLANIRSVGQTMQAYAGANRGRFPHFAAPGTGVVFHNGAAPLRFLDNSAWWTIPMSAWYEGAKLHPTWLCPDDPKFRAYFPSGGPLGPNPADPDYVEFGSYFLAYGAFTTPGLWQLGGQPMDSRYYMVQDWAAIASPSRKGILYEPYPFHDGIGMNEAAGNKGANLSAWKAGHLHSASFGDGSAKAVRMNSLLPGFKDNGWATDMPIATTIDGILGVDLP